jgi:hypothetical protein
VRIDKTALRAAAARHSASTSAPFLLRNSERKTLAVPFHGMTI